MLSWRAANARIVPAVAVLLASAYMLAVILAPAALPLLTVAAPLAACALVLARRRGPRVVTSLMAIAGWFGAAFAVAFLLRHEVSAGLLWIVLGLFLVPLPLVPWLYSRSFLSNHEPRTTNHVAGGGTQ